MLRHDWIDTYVFSIDEKGVVLSWKILDIFEDDYLLIQNVSTGERKCCFGYYNLAGYPTGDPIDYDLDKIIKGAAQVEDLNEVLHFHRELAEDEEPYGWLSPTGEFFHCQCGNHILLARIVLQSSEWGLEQKGWVKVLYDEFFFFGHRLTPEQTRWLKQHGMDEDDVNIASGG